MAAARLRADLNLLFGDTDTIRAKYRPKRKRNEAERDARASGVPEAKRQRGHALLGPVLFDPAEVAPREPAVSATMRLLTDPSITRVLGKGTAAREAGRVGAGIVQEPARLLDASVTLAGAGVANDSADLRSALARLQKAVFAQGAFFSAKAVQDATVDAETLKTRLSTITLVNLRTKSAALSPEERSYFSVYVKQWDDLLREGDALVAQTDMDIAATGNRITGTAESSARSSLLTLTALTTTLETATTTFGTNPTTADDLRKAIDDTRAASAQLETDAAAYTVRVTNAVAALNNTAKSKPFTDKLTTFLAEVATARGDAGAKLGDAETKLRDGGLALAKNKSDASQLEFEGLVTGLDPTGTDFGTEAQRADVRAKIDKIVAKTKEFKVDAAGYRRVLLDLITALTSDGADASAQEAKIVALDKDLNNKTKEAEDKVVDAYGKIVEAEKKAAYDNKLKKAIDALETNANPDGDAIKEVTDAKDVFSSEMGNLIQELETANKDENVIATSGKYGTMIEGTRKYKSEKEQEADAAVVDAYEKIVEAKKKDAYTDKLKNEIETLKTNTNPDGDAIKKVTDAKGVFSGEMAALIQRLGAVDTAEFASVVSNSYGTMIEKTKEYKSEKEQEADAAVVEARKKQAKKAIGDAIGKADAVFESLKQTTVGLGTDSGDANIEKVKEAIGSVEAAKNTLDAGVNAILQGMRDIWETEAQEQTARKDADTKMGEADVLITAAKNAMLGVYKKRVDDELKKVSTALNKLKTAKDTLVATPSQGNITKTKTAIGSVATALGTLETNVNDIVNEGVKKIGLEDAPLAEAERSIKEDDKKKAKDAATLTMESEVAIANATKTIELDTLTKALDELETPEQEVTGNPDDPDKTTALQTAIDEATKARTTFVANVEQAITALDTEKGQSKGDANVKGGYDTTIAELGEFLKTGEDLRTQDERMFKAYKVLTDGLTTQALNKLTPLVEKLTQDTETLGNDTQDKDKADAVKQAIRNLDTGIETYKKSMESASFTFGRVWRDFGQGLGYKELSKTIETTRDEQVAAAEYEKAKAEVELAQGPFDAASKGLKDALGVLSQTVAGETDTEAVERLTKASETAEEKLEAYKENGPPLSTALTAAAESKELGADAYKQRSTTHTDEYNQMTEKTEAAIESAKARLSQAKAKRKIDKGKGEAPEGGGAPSDEPLIFPAARRKMSLFDGNFDTVPDDLKVLAGGFDAKIYLRDDWEWITENQTLINDMVRGYEKKGDTQYLLLQTILPRFLLNDQPTTDAENLGKILRAIATAIGESDKVYVKTVLSFIIMAAMASPGEFTLIGEWKKATPAFDEAARNQLRQEIARRFDPAYPLVESDAKAKQKRTIQNGIIQGLDKIQVLSLVADTVINIRENVLSKYDKLVGNWGAVSGIVYPKTKLSAYAADVDVATTAGRSGRRREPGDEDDDNDTEEDEVKPVPKAKAKPRSAKEKTGASSVSVSRRRKSARLGAAAAAATVETVADAEMVDAFAAAGTALKAAAQNPCASSATGLSGAPRSGTKQFDLLISSIWGDEDNPLDD